MRWKHKAKQPKRKFFRVLLWVGVLVIIGAAAAAPFVYQRAKKWVSFNARTEIERAGFQLVEFQHAETSLTTWREIVLPHVTIVLHSNRPLLGGTSSLINVSADTMTIEVVSISPLVLNIGISGASLRARGSGEASSIASSRLHVQDVWLTTTFRSELRDALTTLRAWLATYGTLLRNGRTSAYLSGGGRLRFTLHNAPTSLGFSLSHDEQGTFVMLNKKEIQQLLKTHFDDDFTAREVEIVSNNPFRAVELLRIKDHAQRDAQRIKGLHPALCEDAYRHVLWSYVLTKRFGSKFAEQVTDSHEAEDLFEMDRLALMDINNNRLGREYALQGVAQAELVEKVKRDPRVISFEGL